MTDARDNRIPEETQTFESLLEESKKILSELRKEVTNGQGILDPITQKKKELVVRLDIIMKQLRHEWILLQKAEEDWLLTNTLPLDNDKKPVTENPGITKAKEKLNLIMQHLKNSIIAITALTIATESDYKTQVDQFNTETADFNEQIESLSKNYALLKKNTAYISRLEYGKDLSIYMSYGTIALAAIVIVGLAWFNKLSETSKIVGGIFYPISATFTTLSNIFGFLGRTIQFFIARTEAQKQVMSETLKEELVVTKALLRKSALLKVLTFSLNLISILAFAGVLATPIGAAFIGAATLIDWIDEGLGAYQRANKILENFKGKHEHAIKNKDPDILIELEILQKKTAKAKGEAMWGFASVVAMFLIACTPIPFAGPALGVIGIGIICVVTIRNTYVTAKPYVERYRGAKKSQQDSQEATIPEKKENELEPKPQPTPARRTPIEELLANPATPPPTKPKEIDHIQPGKIGEKTTKAMGHFTISKLFKKAKSDPKPTIEEPLGANSKHTTSKQ